MKYSLLVLAEPGGSGERTAMQFAQALASSEHSLQRIFFYGAAAQIANALQQPPQNETATYEKWQALASQHQVELVVCIAAALRRGVIDAREAERYNKTASNLADGFLLSGLGQLIEASVTSDRLITFG